jgi:DNA-binding CsgD family transcriptional regulator
MPASLCIHILSPEQEKTGEEIRFFDSEDWNSESEKQVLAKIQEIFALTRSSGVSVHFDITIQTHEISQASFLLKKKAVNQVEINNYKLSIREIEVLGLIMQGLTNNEIAEKLFISFETVRSHRKNILEKTGAKNTAALINYYHQTFFDK